MKSNTTAYVQSLEPSTPPQTGMETPLTVLSDHGNKVVISIAVPGLKKSHSLWKSLTSIFHKSSDPFRLATNAKFGKYSLTATSIDMEIEIFEDKQAMKKSGSSEVKQRYFCKINQFPSRINPESAEFEVNT